MQSNSYEVYMQVRDDGLYYIGMTNGNRKSYKGSGKIFRRIYNRSPNRWTKHIISNGLDVNQAKWLERCMVGYEVVSDNRSLNLKVGGDYNSHMEGDKNPMRDPKVVEKVMSKKRGMTYKLTQTAYDYYDRKRGVPSWNKGVREPTVVCPHCSKEGGRNAMKRYHFDNCKHK